MSRRPVGRWLFGKLPAHGDFVCRGLDDHALRDGLDAWLAEDLAAARGAYPDFEDRYDRAPAWTFVDCDARGDWSGGALCASVDRAGRRFPVILAGPAADAAGAAGLSLACLGALGDALAEGWDADRLQQATLAPQRPVWAPAAPEWALLSEEGAAAHREAGRFPKNVVSTMLEFAP